MGESPSEIVGVAVGGGVGVQVMIVGLSVDVGRRVWVTVGVAVGVQVGGGVALLDAAGGGQEGLGGGQQQDAAALVHLFDGLHDLAHRLLVDLAAAAGAVRHTDAGVEEAQVVVDLGRGSDGRPAGHMGGSTGRPLHVFTQCQTHRIVSEVRFSPQMADHGI